MRLVLASGSPRREQLLRATGLRFEVAPPPESDAPPAHARSYVRLVQELALSKARAVASERPGLVVGADTIVVCAGEVLGKPGDRASARRMLHLLSGRRHLVYTGLALVGPSGVRQGWERTAVLFRALRAAEVERYLDSGEPMDKAGAYAIQGLGAVLVADIRGCYTNVIGLPVPRLLAMLAEGEGAEG